MENPYLQSLALAQQKSEEKVEYGIQRAELGIQESVATKLNELERKKLDHALQRIGKLESLQPRIINCDGQIVWRIDNFN